MILETIWSCSELASDELVVTTKGGDWYDGGVLIQLHQQEFSADNGFFNNAWNTLYGGIGTTNRLIFQFEELEAAGNTEAAAFIAELRGISFEQVAEQTSANFFTLFNINNH